MSFLDKKWMILAMLLLGAGLAQAQQRAVVLIDTNLPEATLYADSTRLGPASLGTFLVPTETRRLRLVPPGDGSWTITPIEAPLAARPGDTLSIDLAFPYHYQIETIPFGATVFLDDLGERAPLGETPVLFAVPEMPDGVFVIEHPGYARAEVTPGNEVWNRYLITLEPVQAQEAASAEQAWRPPARRRQWIDYSAAAVAVAAGALSVHYKFKADRLNDRYQQNGDPTLRPEIKALDTRAGVALGVMQAGLGVLAIRFILK